MSEYTVEIERSPDIDGAERHRRLGQVYALLLSLNLENSSEGDSADGSDGYPQGLRAKSQTGEG